MSRYHKSNKESKKKATRTIRERRIAKKLKQSSKTFLEGSWER